MQLPPKARSARRLTSLSPLQQEERGRFLLGTCLWALAVLALALVSYRSLAARLGDPGMLTDPDAMDAAQIARNMAQGHGYATGFLRPLAVSGFAGPDPSGVAPDVTRAPLYPLLLALTFALHHGTGGDKMVVGLSLFLFLLTVGAVYRLGRTLFPTPELAWIALLSAGLYGVGGEALTGALSGGPAMLATLLVTALLIAMHGAAETPQRPAGLLGAAWVGVLLGLCYLTQYSLCLLAPPVLVYLFFSRAPSRAWAGVAACAVGFLVAAGGWMARTALVSHAGPFFTLLLYGVMTQTPDYPGQTAIYRSAAPTFGPLAYFFGHPALMVQKLGGGLAFYRANVLLVFNVFLLAAAAASLLWRMVDVRVGALRACAFAGLLGIVLVSSVFEPVVQMLAPFAPLVTVVGVGFVFALAVQQEWDPFLRRTVLWILGLLVGVGGVVQMVGQRPPPALVARGMKLLTSVGLTPINNPYHAPSDAVLSDAALEIAWRVDLPAVWLPADNVAYAMTRTAFRNADPGRETGALKAILLTPELNGYDRDDSGDAEAWTLLAKTPSAYDQLPLEKARLDVEARQLAAMIAHHKDVSRYMPPPYTLENLQYLVNNNKAALDVNYQSSFESISDILAGFQERSSVPEDSELVPGSNDTHSVLFLPRTR